jgi:methylated-DNA-protein-cysteine methyltransferase related protein
MAGSPFFARIKADVLRMVAAIPPGRVASFRDIGAHLDVMPRHVAHILATLAPQERDGLAWWRAVPQDGRPGHAARAPEQDRLLAAEGIARGADGRLTEFERIAIAVAALPHGVPRQRRPADAPPATRAAPPRRRRPPRSAR